MLDPLNIFTYIDFFPPVQDQLKRLLRHLELRGQMKKAKSIDSRPDEVEDLDDTECEHLKYTEMSGRARTCH